MTVQQMIEESLSKILNQNIKIHGCGRTDAGVHASQYFFHINIEKDWADSNLEYKLNRLLPKDISVLKIFKVDRAVNAQKSATSRTYNYYIHLRKNPFIDHLSYFELETLVDLNGMKQAIQLLEGKHDFRFLSKSPDKVDNCICNILQADLVIDNEKKHIKIIIKGNRFLHNMIRIIVGNVLKIGKGKMSAEEFKEILHLDRVPKHFELAHPQGLFLSQVEYPSLEVGKLNHLEEILESFK